MHLFRKYLDNRGSALFMVISVMTAIMVSCMAMYFSVVSSRSTQYAVFNQQQSKQSAVSISDAVLAGMMDGTNSSMNDLVERMFKLNIGEKLTTDGNGFAAFDPSGTKQDDPNLGSYMIEITRVSENTFDIVITSSVNGINDVYHTIIDLEMGESAGAPSAPTQIFAATGYVPNDVFLDGGRFITDVFFDNEQTIVNAYGGKNMELWGNLSAGGSLTVYGYLIPSKTKSVTFAVRNTYTANFNQPVGFAGSPYEKSTVLIGGNCYLNENNGFSNANVYILGDLYISGNPDLDTSNYYVDGNIYVNGRQTPWGFSGFWVNLKNVYCNGTIDNSGNPNGGINGGASMNGTTGKTNKNWKEDGVNAGAMTVAQMVKLLDEKTASNEYYKWVINDNKPTKDGYVKELDEKVMKTAVHKTLHFSQNSEHPIPTIELVYSKDEKGCIIDDVTCEKGNTSFNHIALIIDTGTDEDNVYTIRVKPNRDYDGDNKNETFSWYPFKNNDSSTFMSILVKGCGSVLIDVPQGVIYQDMSFFKCMHYGWYLLGGARPDTTKFAQKRTYNSAKGYWESTTIYNTSGIDNGSADVNYEKFIHTKCESGDGCKYTEKDSTDTCTQHTDTYLKTVNCSVHGSLNNYCPKCNPKDDHFGECINHVGRKEIDAYLASNSSLKTLMGTYTAKDDKGKDVEKVIYPTTNIFIISCDESANIRLSILENGSKIMQNSFFGYIYAPYMTFKACGDNAGGGMVRLFGGMTVSDYVIDDSMSMVACWPEKMPLDLMSDECKKNQLAGITTKSWKITLTGH